MMKKLSLVNLSLLATSTIAAAFAPAKESKGKIVINGMYTLSTGRPISSGDFTCRQALPDDPISANCSYTVTGNGNINPGLSPTSGIIFSDSISADNDNNTQSLTSARGID